MKDLTINVFSNTKNPHRIFTKLPLIMMAALFCASTLWLASRYYINTPLSDEWAVIDFIRRSWAGKLSLSDWFSLYDQHRITLNRLVFMADFAWFGGQRIMPLALNFAVQGGLAYLLARVAQNRSKESFLSFVIIFCSCFSGIIAEGLSIAWLIKYFVVNLCVVGSLYCHLQYCEHSLPKHNSRFWLTGAFLWIILAACTLGNGIILAPVLCIISFLQRRPKNETILWIALSILILSLHFYIYDPKHSYHTDHGIFQNISTIFFYYLGLLANPLFFLPNHLVMLLGLLGIWLTYRALRTARSDQDYALLGIMLFILITDAMIALTRFQLAGAATCRYIIGSLLFWIVQILFWKSYTSHITHKRICLTFLAFLSWGQYHSITHRTSERWGNDFRYYDLLKTAMMSEIDARPILPELIHVRISNFLEAARFLKQHHLSFFKNPDTHWLGQEIKDIAAISTHQPLGKIQSVHSLREGLVIQGLSTHLIPRNIIITDQNKKIIGYGVGGIYGDIEMFSSYKPGLVEWMIQTGQTTREVANADHFTDGMDLPNTTSSKHGWIGFAHTNPGEPIRIYEISQGKGIKDYYKAECIFDGIVPESSN